MKTITTNIYQFHELSEKGQRLAWEKSSMDFSDDHGDEFRATLAAFEKIFDIGVYHYDVGSMLFNPSFDYVTAGDAVDAPTGDPIRLAKFIWNNYADHILKGKFYSTRGEYVNGKYHYKKRYSNIMKSFYDCPLTGVCYDYDILQPVIDCLHYKRFFNSYDDLMHACLANFFRAWDAEIEFSCSFEYFADAADANGWYFTENGEFYKGA